jgi:predicted DsbA family dithiol-disulfide isomerase
VLKRRYGAAVTWLPFDLHPEYPPEGVPRTERHHRIKPAFDAYGLTYDVAETIPNSQLALRVAELARDRGVFDAVHARLMDASWAEARDLGDVDELRALAAEGGLDDIVPALTDERYAVRVQVSTDQAQQLGVNGIPAFLLDSKLLVLGAQPLEVFEQAYEQLSADAQR